MKRSLKESVCGPPHGVRVEGGPPPVEPQDGLLRRGGPAGARGVRAALEEEQVEEEEQAGEEQVEEGEQAGEEEQAGRIERGSFDRSTGKTAMK